MINVRFTDIVTIEEGNAEMRNLMISGAMLLAITTSTAAYADSVAYNATPADTWVYGRPGNNTTNDTVVETTTAGDQLYLRWKQNSVGVPAGTGGNGIYYFTNAQNPLNYDWGFDTSGTFGGDRAPSDFTGITALITLTNLATNMTFVYNPLGTPNDNYFNARTADDIANNRARSTGAPTGSVQNSANLSSNFLRSLGYTPGADGAFRIQLDVTGLTGGPQSLTADAIVGNGVPAVPEPATWAMMLVGFGLVAGAARYRRRRTALTYA